eukprot:TRINITY_DN11070_c0_g1_i1.p1 TRINITY_DN11070_c0_g1~~TRINITY_DN11070_c0_g1_i1.p1  ORF type:complete len:322 (-),score=63.67 TRINITY_DN11070_c0_g1_i1:19-984(-)
MQFLLVTIVVLFSVSGCLAAKPVIIDTDIGQDFDDSWAVALSLKRPEIDIKMILTAAHNPTGRAQIVAKYLQTVGRTDIPIGIGIFQDDYVGPLYGWAKNYSLSSYPGKVYTDGITQAINIIESSTEVVTMLAIAPVVNFQAILKKRPDLASKVNVVAMSGSIKVCYGGGQGPCPEYNVVEDIPASQLFYNTTWAKPTVTTPIDTGYVAIIDGPIYQNLMQGVNKNVILKTLIECYFYWHENGGGSGTDPHTSSTILWDAVAAWLNWSDDSFVNLVPLHVHVDGKGLTITDTSSPLIEAALTWKQGGLDGWRNTVVTTLLN